jgi:hypothetical protein
MNFHKTPVAAAALGVTYHRLIDLVRFHKITPPHRDTSGHFIWMPADMERARAALQIDRRRTREAVPCH